MPGVSALVLTGTLLKVPIDPLNPAMVADAVPMFIVPVPDGTLLVPALSLPVRVMLCPWLIVSEGSRFWNVGVSLLTSSPPVSECVPLRLPVPVTVKL